MKCPQCQASKPRISETDESLNGKEELRQRVCRACGYKWWTREIDAERLRSPIPPSRRRQRWFDQLKHWRRSKRAPQ